MPFSWRLFQRAPPDATRASDGPPRVQGDVLGRLAVVLVLVLALLLLINNPGALTGDLAQTMAASPWAAHAVGLALTHSVLHLAVQPRVPAWRAWHGAVAAAGVYAAVLLAARCDSRLLYPALVLVAAAYAVSVARQAQPELLATPEEARAATRVQRACLLLALALAGAVAHVGRARLALGPDFRWAALTDPRVCLQPAPGLGAALRAAVSAPAPMPMPLPPLHGADATGAQGADALPSALFANLAHVAAEPPAAATLASVPSDVFVSPLR